MKKILTTFIILFIWFVSFCSSVYLSEWDWNRYWSSSVWLNAWTTANIWPDWNWEILWYWTFCVSFSRWNCVYDWITYSTNWTTKTLCFFNDSSSTINFSVSCTNTYTAKAYYYTFTSVPLTWSLFECEECEECVECPTIDSEYCVSNDLCPSSDCPVYTWDSNWSSLYINDIQHEGAWTINITIPDEFNWDYTNENDVFDLDIEWYNVDTEYIDWIIRTQNYQPTTEDLTNIFSNFGYFGGLLVACLFVILVFYMIKKIFS